MWCDKVQRRKEYERLGVWKIRVARDGEMRVDGERQWLDIGQTEFHYGPFRPFKRECARHIWLLRRLSLGKGVNSLVRSLYHLPRLVIDLILFI